MESVECMVNTVMKHIIIVIGMLLAFLILIGLVIYDVSDKEIYITPDVAER